MQECVDITDFDHKTLKQTTGRIILGISGKGAWRRFSQEAGGHRWQHIPPTERRGRVQTSSITVAVLKSSGSSTDLDLKDVDIHAARGKGPGGQHKNVTNSFIRVVHRPTGMTVSCQEGRSQHSNKEIALTELRRRLDAAQQDHAREQVDESRRDQIGNGYRGQKIRTIQVQNQVVLDHINNRKIPLKKYLKGSF